MKFRIVEELYKGTTLYSVEKKGWFFWSFVTCSADLSRAKELLEKAKRDSLFRWIGVVYEE